MTPIHDFETLVSRLSSDNAARTRVAVVCPADEHTRQAVARAISDGFADCTLYVTPGCDWQADGLAELAGKISVVTLDTPDDAARRAVADVRAGLADVLMKGLINTDNLLRAVLDKTAGLLPPGRVLSHLTAMQVPGRDKLLFFSDAAVIPSPTAAQRIAQAHYVADACRSFGIDEPRIALIHCTEKTSPKFPVTLDYADIIQRAGNGEFGKAVFGGPIDVKAACDAEAAAIKGLTSPVCGNADALIFPDIEAGNVFYKTMTCFCHALTAGTLVGTTAPVVVPSRSDSAAAKFASLAMACLMSRAARD
ncbi:MAG: phosphate acyltransferase [Bacteroidales bacterium]|nr:phosphate acyltransferase [Bacteroidales bacterium]